MVKLEDTGRRTDDGSLWRRVFRNTKIALFWGQPIYRLTEDLSIKVGDFSHVIERGFETDLGTTPGIFGVIVDALEWFGWIKPDLHETAILHDDMWGDADNLPLEDQSLAYHIADVYFYHYMLQQGQTKWYAYIVFKIVRLVAWLKIIGRKVNENR